MKCGVLIFPGTWSHQDFAHVLADVLRCDWGYLWHKETSVAGYDCLILPGGFAHGDYLRCGAIARFSPIMEAVVRFARNGGLPDATCRWNIPFRRSRWWGRTAGRDQSPPAVDDK